MAYFFALGIAIPDNTKIPMNNSDDFEMFPIQAVRKEVRQWLHTEKEVILIRSGYPVDMIHQENR